MLAWSDLLRWRTDARKRVTRSLTFESLSHRVLLAFDLAVSQPLVAQFPAQVTLNASDESFDFRLGNASAILAPSPIDEVIQSEIVGNSLYTVGRHQNFPALVQTDLTTGASERFILPAIVGNSGIGSIKDVGSANNAPLFIGESLANGAPAPVTWQLNQSPIPISTSGSQSTPSGTANDINSLGQIVGSFNSGSAFVKFGSLINPLPSDGSGLTHKAAAISSSGNFIIGTAGSANVIWKAVGNPAVGNYQLLSMSLELPVVSQGANPLQFVADDSAEGALLIGSFRDVQGLPHASVWSATTGRLMRDFGPNTSIQDIESVGNQTFVAYNRPAGAQLLNLTTGESFEIDILTSSTGPFSFAPGALSKRTEANSLSLGITYFATNQPNSLKAALLPVAQKITLLEFDFDRNGSVDAQATQVALPFVVDHVFTQLGPFELAANIRLADGSLQQVSNSATSVSSAIVANQLRIGGTTANDTIVFNRLANGSNQLNVNGTSTNPSAFDSIAIRGGNGTDSLQLIGAQSLDVSALRSIERIELDASSSIQVRGLSESNVVAAKGTTETQIVLDANDQLFFEGEWSLVQSSRSDGKFDQVMKRGAAQLNVLSTVARNPANALDTNGDGRSEPIDALLVINFLNSGGANNGGSLEFPLDTDGDGDVEPLDALLVINFLNNQT